MGEEFVPDVEWKVGVDGAEPRNKMIFEGLDGSFCLVTSMEAYRGKLEINVIVVDFV